MNRDLHALAVSALDNILARGFVRPTFDTLPEKLMFVVTELDEAHREMTAGRSPEEMVDVVLRLLGCLEGVWPGAWNVRRHHPIATAYDRPAELLWPVIGWLTLAAQHWRDDKKTDVQIALEFALRDAWALLCYASGGELAAWCECTWKIERNARRPALNGHTRST
jgi:hypothetical protein